MGSTFECCTEPDQLDILIQKCEANSNIKDLRNWHAKVIDYLSVECSLIKSNDVIILNIIYLIILFDNLNKYYSSSWSHPC